ncbi:hypothetical protein L1887_10248 [Cichorium endivia]|nr:hypothetical protein L1887_10248 [Cichorium endivia]
MPVNSPFGVASAFTISHPPLSRRNFVSLSLSLSPREISARSKYGPQISRISQFNLSYFIDLQFHPNCSLTKSFRHVLTHKP